MPQNLVVAIPGMELVHILTVTVRRTEEQHTCTVEKVTRDSDFANQWFSEHGGGSSSSASYSVHTVYYAALLEDEEFALYLEEQHSDDPLGRSILECSRLWPEARAYYRELLLIEA